MKSYRKELWFNTPDRVAFINITGEVQKAIRESEIKEGFCLVKGKARPASILLRFEKYNDHFTFTPSSASWVSTANTIISNSTQMTPWVNTETYAVI